MDTFYRARLTLERAEQYADSYGNLSERRTEIASHTVTGDTPADAMVQLCAHADSLHDWHVTQEDNESAAVLDEAVKLGPPAYDLSKLFKDLFVVPPHRHHCSICGKPGPVLHEGNTYVCADCNAVLDAQKAEAERAAEPLVCHCSTTQHDTGIELHPDADCPVHGENRPTVEGIADVAEKPAPTAWCGDPDHEDPCNNCEAVLEDAAGALRQRIPGGEQ